MSLNLKKSKYNIIMYNMYCYEHITWYIHALHLLLHRSDQVKMSECVAYSKTQTHTSGSGGVVYDDIGYM